MQLTTSFAILASAAAVAASPAVARAGNCATENVKCCDQVKDASSIDTATLELLGIDELAGQVGKLSLYV